MEKECSEQCENEENINKLTALSPIREENDISSSTNQSFRQIDDEKEPSFFDDSDKIVYLDLSGTDPPCLKKSGKVLSLPNIAASSPNITSPINVDLVRGTFSGNISSFLNQPSTPPEVLRQKINIFEREVEYLKNEHNELLEFTSLEKQLSHDNCISKDKMNYEITSLNERIEMLMKENCYVKRELEEREEDIKHLKITLSEYKHEAKDVIKSLLINACQKYEKFPEEVRNSPLLKDLLEKSDFDVMHTGSILSKETNNLSQNAFEELDGLRNLIIGEIIAMDLNESKGDLMNSTSEEVFLKLMQVVMKKQVELSSNLKYDTEKLEDDNGKLKNSLNSQKSWIQELENENEKLNRELSKINGIHNDSLSTIKNLTCNIETTENQLLLLKTECSRLVSNNDLLKAELDVLKELNQQKKLRSSSCQTDLLLEKNDESNKFDDSLSNAFEQEITMFIDFINSINIECNEITLTGCDRFVFLKDSVEQVQDKLLCIQNNFNFKLSKLEEDFIAKKSQLIDIKNNMSNICKVALDNNKQLISCIPDVEGGFKLASGDFSPSVVYEIDDVKDDYLVVNDLANSLKQRIDDGCFLLRELSKYIATILNFVVQKDDHINKLKKTIEKETELLKMRERKIYDMEKEELHLKEIIARNKEDLDNRERKISRITSAVFNKLDNEFLKDHPDFNETIKVLEKKLAAYGELVVDCDFFSNQFKMLIDFTLKLITEYDDLSHQVKELNNMLLNHIKNYGPLMKFKISDVTLQNIFDTTSQICSDYIFLRDSQEKLKKQNSNLKFELDSSQDSIRQMRTELRNLRKQDRSRSYQNCLKMSSKKKDLATQTECSVSEQEKLLSDLKESLHKSNARILHLEIQIQHEDFPNLKRAELIDKSLAQAKDKIKDLQMDLIYQKRYNQELTQQIKMLKSCKQSAT